MKFGIDVSRWQKGLNFNTAKAEGVSFVIIKSTQEEFTDPCFDEHYKSAKAAGLDVGAYHYLKANNPVDAVKEAHYCIKVLNGKQFSYPIFLDFEESIYTKNSRDYNDSIITAFCAELEKVGYWCGLYTNFDFYKNYINGEKLAKRYALWIASWGSKIPVANAPMWQFGGEVNKIRSNKIAGIVCDQNYCYVDYPSSIKARGLNGYSAPKAEAPKEEKPEPDYAAIGKAVFQAIAKYINV